MSATFPPGPSPCWCCRRCPLPCPLPSPQSWLLPMPLLTMRTRLLQGELVAIFGTNLGPTLLAGAQVTEDGEFVTQLTGNVRVLFNGFAAPMIYSSAGQVAAAVPYEVALASNAAVQVEVQGVRSEPFMIPVDVSAPAIFTANASGKGRARS